MSSVKKDIDFEKLRLFSQNIRRKILEMAYDAGSSSAHFGGAVAGLLFTVILVPSIIFESTMTLLLLILTIILSLYLIKRLN